MMEIPDTFRGGHNAQIVFGVEEGEVGGGGIALPIRLGGLGEHHKLLQRGPGGVPVENGFGEF